MDSSLRLVDESGRFSYVQGRHNRQNRISADKLHDIGLRNLEEYAAAHLDVRDCGTYFAVLATNFEASLILLDHLSDT